MEKMEESTESTVTEETELLDFPDEILLNIMIHMNDTTLLNMALVCERLKAIAKEAFTKKYNGTNQSSYFEVNISHRNLMVEREQYQPLFSTFGENMVAIYIWFSRGNVARNHWIFAMIRRFCINLSKIEIGGGDEVDLLKMFRSLPKPSLTHLAVLYTNAADTNWSEYRHPNLIKFHVDEGCNFEQQEIVDFISTNTQLEEIHLKNVEVDNYVPILEAIGNKCENFRKLEIMDWHRDMVWNSEMIDILCKLSSLNCLEINAHGLKLGQLESLVRRLPNLSSLRLNHTAATSEIYENLTRAVSICQRISELKIRTKDPDFAMLTNELLTYIADEIMISNKMVVLKEAEDEIVIVKGEVQRNKVIVYKHDATDGNQPATNFLDLNDDCLAKIIEFLKPKHHCALYDTCQRTRKAVEEFYSKNVFCARFTSKEVTESILWCLGKQIRLMKLSRYWISTRNEFEELWRRINQYCINLNQLTIVARINRNGDDFVTQVDCEWPSAEKLMFTTYRVDYETLCSIFCPSLTHLEVSNLRIDGNILDHGDHFRHLTVLKFGYYNESVKKFLLAVDDKVLYEQIQELSIGSQHFMAESDADDETDDDDDDEPSQDVVELVSIVPRFRKLTKLKLIVPGVNRCNTKYLFQNCTKLAHFGVWCKDDLLSGELFEHIMDNCLHIGTIRLFGHGIYGGLLQIVSEMFPNASVEVAI
ncbi:uncharacterized protein LOC129573603 [Sitodiplosis mosellana]|uniref:uncharacterized protein LOC129573603 n=1 Tax=Sitodiplosis mosellana TaxID=263140 RepID=UPI002444EBE6|nr:uncharacterized protein LOC129573603 [Sitodiplosis mosellana]